MELVGNSFSVGSEALPSPGGEAGSPVDKGSQDGDWTSRGIPTQCWALAKTTRNHKPIAQKGSEVTMESQLESSEYSAAGVGRAFRTSLQEGWNMEGGH